MSNKQLRSVFLSLLICLLCCPEAFAQTTAFTYQGKLTDAGASPTGNYDLQFTVWDASSSQRTLFIMLLVTLVLLPIVVIYTSWVFHVLRGTITLEHVREKGKSY